MNRRLRFTATLFPLALLLWGTLLHAQAPAPAPPAAVTPLVAQSQADVTAKRFADAVALLQSQPTAQTDAALRHALADTQYAWAQDLLAHSQYAQSIPHYQTAYDLDKGNRLKQSGDDLRRLGVAYDDLSQHQKAIDLYQQALAVAKQAGDQDDGGKALMDIGSSYNSLSQYAKAIDYLQQALPIYQQTGDKEDEAKNFANLGDAYKGLSQPAKAIDFYQQELLIHRQAGDTDSEAGDLVIIGDVYKSLSQPARAIDYYQQALPIYRQARDTGGEATALNSQGIAYEDLSQYQKAIDFYQQALAIHKQDGDKDNEANDLTLLGNAYKSLSQPAKAIDYFQQALPIYRLAGDRSGEANDLLNTGVAYDDLSQPAKAIDFYQQALVIFRQARDNDGQAKALTNLGNAYNSLSQYAKAIDYLQQALPIYQQTGDKEDEAKNFANLGDAYKGLSQPAKAIDFYQQELLIHRQARDTGGEAGALTKMGSAYLSLSRYAKARDFYQQALPIYRQAGDLDTQANEMMNIGATYFEQSQYAKAIDYFQQALDIHRKAPDRDAEAEDLTDLGDSYYSLGQYGRAIDYFRQARPLFQQAHDKINEAKNLNSLASVYGDIGQLNDAIGYYRRAIDLYRQASDSDGEAIALSNEGDTYFDLKQPITAISLLRRALLIHRHTGDRDAEAYDMMKIGNIYGKFFEFGNATAYFLQALPIVQETGNRKDESAILGSLMIACQYLKLPRLAIFYGKQAVNIYQSIRADLQAKNTGGRQILDAKTQQDYLVSVSDTYHSLIDLLIAQGRLPEAEDVLAMLKQQEVTDFVRRDAALTPTALTILFDPAERTADADYQKYADPVTQMGQQVDALDAQITALPKGSPQKITLASQKVALQAKLGPAQQAFHAFQTDQLPKELATRPPGSDDTAQLAQQSHGPFQGALAAMGPGTVALLTIVEPDKYRVIVITSKTEKDEQYPIKAEDLRRLVLKWREALSDPRADPRPLGEQLSKILIGPIAADLIGAKAQTLLWSLDDVLRYVPVAALYAGGRTVHGQYDPAGGHYLVENYRSAVFTGASLPTAAAQPADWGAADPAIVALGVTQPHTVTDPRDGRALDFPSLPGVDRELKAIDRYDGNPGGALGGSKPLEDKDFSETALRLALALKPPVVHIASHFQLGTDDKDTFLLLGDGTPLTLDKLYNGSGGQVFQGVDLLTLSACQTAEAGTTGDGHEVESLASVSQSQGASSILASLWPVFDATTPLLMQQFYRLRAGTPGMSKAEALRQAELSLLRGTLAVAPAPTRQTASGDAPPRGAGDAPPFVADPKAPYAHPYYWAPFVLIGNWK